MTGDLHVRVLGQRVIIRAPDPLAGVLASCLAGVAIDPVADPAVDALDANETIEFSCVGGDRWCMRAGPDETPGNSVGPARLVARLLEHLNRAAAASVPDHIPFHAAAVARSDGRIVLIAGASGSGKSTLGAAAVRSGWRLVAEEVAAVDPATHRVRPYHRPIGLRSGGAAAVGIEIPDDRWFGEVFPWCPPSDTLAAGGRLAAVLVVDRNGSAGALRALRPAAALTELIRHVVVPDDERVAPVFRRMAELVREVPVRQLSVESLAVGLAALDQLVPSP